MEHIGYSLIDANGTEVEYWGDTQGVLRGIPDVLHLPNGDAVHCPSVGTLQTWRLVPRVAVVGPQSKTFDGTNVVVGFPVTASDINKERDRRLATFTFGGVVYDFNDGRGSQENIAGASTLALGALIAGAQPKNLRWANPDRDFTWIARDNTMITMDAPTMFSFGKSAASFKGSVMFAARALKNSIPLPVDHTDDKYWPPS